MPVPGQSWIPFLLQSTILQRCWEYCLLDRNSHRLRVFDNEHVVAVDLIELLCLFADLVGSQDAFTVFECNGARLIVDGLDPGLQFALDDAGA